MKEGIKVSIGAQAWRGRRMPHSQGVLWAGQSGPVAVAVPSPAPHARLALLIKADNVFLCQLQERCVWFNRTLLS